MNYYAYHYIDTSNGDNYISIYEGVYYKQSTRGNITYPAAKPIGCINITQRKICKSTHFLCKISTVQPTRLFFPNNRDEYLLLDILLTNLGYDDTLKGDIITAINSLSNMPKLVSHHFINF